MSTTSPAQVRQETAWETSEKDHAPSVASALHVAVRKGCIDDVACLLLLEETNLEEKDDKGRTALHAACEKGCKAEIKVEMIRMLLSAGACIDAIDNNLQTPLHVASVASASK